MLRSVAVFQFSVRLSGIWATHEHDGFKVFTNKIGQLIWIRLNCQHETFPGCEHNLIFVSLLIRALMLQSCLEILVLPYKKMLVEWILDESIDLKAKIMSNKVTKVVHHPTRLVILTEIGMIGSFRKLDSWNV